MLLRRVIAHFRKQEWTAIGLDFLIVVVGVFIGIQVANLNTAREDRALGEDYAKRLSADLQRDFAATRDLVNYYSAVRDNIEEADRLLSAADYDSRQLVVAAYRASEIATAPPNRATWDQIVSSGHLGLLPDGVIDSGLSEYYNFTESKAFADGLVQNSKYRQTVRAIIPIEVQKAMREGCSDVVNEIGVITGFTPECRLAATPAVLNATAKQLRSHETIRDDLRYQYSLVAVVLNNSSGSLDVIERVLAALGQPQGSE